jgi:hypothetical protein
MNSSSGLRVAPINQSGGDGAILFRASAAGEALIMIAGIGNGCGMTIAAMCGCIFVCKPVSTFSENALSIWQKPTLRRALDGAD